MLALISTIHNGEFNSAKHIGCFSYGSGCCGEFFSGVVTQDGQKRIQSLNIQEQLDQRYQLSMAEYDSLLQENHVLKFGTRNTDLDLNFIAGARNSTTPRLYLTQIKEFYRKYEWL